MAEGDDKPARRQRPGSGARKPPVPDVMRVVEAISNGEYDNKIGIIQGALDDRKALKQEEVAKMVKEVFGDEYVVTKPQPNPVPPAAVAQPQPLPFPDDPSAAPTAPPAPAADGIGSALLDDESGIESRGARFDIPPGGDVPSVGLGGDEQ